MSNGYYFYSICLCEQDFFLLAVLVLDKVWLRSLLVVYFDQIPGAARTQKLVETLLGGRFQTFFLIFKVF